MDAELIRKIKLYLKRTEEDKFAEIHPLQEEGDWVIIGGASRYYGRHNEIMAVVQGRFVDAVAYAVQQPKFYELSRKGYITKLKPKRLEAVGDLEKLVE